MQPRTQLVIVLLLLVCAACSIEAQITSNPIPAPITKRGLAVEIKTSSAFLKRAGCVPPIRTSRLRAGRASATSAISRMAAASPTIRAGSST